MHHGQFVRRYADVVNTIAAIVLIVLQTYQGSQARQIQDRLNEIEWKQKVILKEMGNDSTQQLFSR